MRTIALVILLALSLSRLGAPDTMHPNQDRTGGLSGPQTESPGDPDPPAEPDGVGTGQILARQPVAFVPNLGQWDGAFTHKARFGPMTVFLQERGWTFTLEERPQRPEPDPFALRTPQPEPSSAPARGVAVQMRFEGGAGPALPVEERRLPGVHNYFLGNDPDLWRSNVPLHGAVLFDGLYPGIDLRARSDDGHFEYDLLVEPGADLDQVVVQVVGADGLRLNPEGALIIDTALGPVRQPLPRTWQVDAFGASKEVRCRYVLRGENRFGFEVTEWDRDLALIVDPGLVYSTFLGGSQNDLAVALAVDATGATTVAGRTHSTNFPTTPGAFSTTFSGGAWDVFVARLNSSGSALIYATFIGGPYQALTTDLALDAAGAATVAGYTNGPGIYPTTPGAFSTASSGGNFEAFVTRLDPSGSALVYSTFLGGSGDDWATALALESTGVATVAGTTTSSNFPTTLGAFDTTHNGGSQDAFVARLSPAGSALVYSTFLGGSGNEALWALALDNTGAATVAGGTWSSDFPTTPGAFDTSYSVGDAYVTRLDPSGSTLTYSTFLGGTGADSVGALALDATGAATLGGMTQSTDFPTTQGAFDVTHGGASDAFAARLDPSGSALIYSTFIGGSSDDRVEALALDASGGITLAGVTASTNFPTTPGAFDTTYNGVGVFVARLDPSGTALIYSTLLGGSCDDRVGRALAVDANGSTTIAGRTCSGDFPVTPGAFDTTHNGPSFNAGDAFVTRLDLGPTIYAIQPGGPGTQLTIDNGYLIPGNEYYNIFSLDLCPAGPGSGPYLGLCATTLANIQFIVLQASLPVGSPPFHFVALGSSVSWGPYSIGPGTLDAVCLDITGGVLGSYSAVTRITIQ